MPSTGCRSPPKSVNASARWRRFSGSSPCWLASDRSKFGTQFANSQLVVFADAPHPCYLRDVAAAEEFTALIVEFVTGDQAAGPGLDVHAAW